MLFFLILQDTTFFYKSPTKAIILSLTIPAGGQFYNEKKTKGFIISSIEVFSTSLLVYNAYQYQKYKTESYYWATIGYFITFLGIKMFSMLDAYIDANIINAKRSQIELKEKIRF
ncbi:MAG: DUF5683 domain-containing protein [candidate division WOR-3 bacterium]